MLVKKISSVIHDIDVEMAIKTFCKMPVLKRTFVLFKLTKEYVWFTYLQISKRR